MSRKLQKTKRSGKQDHKYLDYKQQLVKYLQRQPINETPKPWIGKLLLGQLSFN